MHLVKASGGGSVAVDDDGTEVVAEASGLNFGTGLSVTDDGSGEVTIDLSATGDGAYAETIGDGSATSFTVTHNLGTEDVHVQVWDVSGTDPALANGDPSSVEATDDNTVTVTFGSAPSTDQYRVVVLAAGSSGGDGGGSPSLLHVRDEKTAGTSGGSAASGSWLTRTLNTAKTNEIDGASLSSNQVTLPAGTYYVEGSGGARNPRVHRTRVRDVTNGTTLAVGQTAISNSSSVVTESVSRGQFTLDSSATIELQHRVENSSDFGIAVDLGEVEVYAEMSIWQLS